MIINNTEIFKFKYSDFIPFQIRGPVCRGSSHSSKHPSWLAPKAFPTSLLASSPRNFLRPRISLQIQFRPSHALDPSKSNRNHSCRLTVGWPAIWSSTRCSRSPLVNCTGASWSLCIAPARNCFLLLTSRLSTPTAFRFAKYLSLSWPLTFQSHLEQHSNQCRVAYRWPSLHCRHDRQPTSKCHCHSFYRRGTDPWTYDRHPSDRCPNRASCCRASHPNRADHRTRWKVLCHWAYCFSIHRCICFHQATDTRLGPLSMHSRRIRHTDCHHSTFPYQSHAVCLNSSTQRTCFH